MRWKFSAVMIPVVLVTAGVAAAGAPVLTIDDEHASALISIHKAFEELKNVAAECRSSGKGMATCLCDEEEALQRMDATLQETLAAYPEWSEKSVQYTNFEGDRTLVYQMPALKRQVNNSMSQCSQ